MDFITNQIADEFAEELDKVFEKAFAVHGYDRDWIERNKDKITHEILGNLHIMSACGKRLFIVISRVEFARDTYKQIIEVSHFD